MNARQLIESEWRKTTLGEILNNEQLLGVVAILNQPGEDMEKVPALKAFLGKHKKDLEQKEMDADFLAYYLAFNANAMRRLS